MSSTGCASNPGSQVKLARSDNKPDRSREAVADFIDDLRWARDEDDIARRITGRPRDPDPRTDAYLAAHFATAHEAPLGQRTQPFLSSIWWPRYPGLRARAIVESPAAQAC